MTTIDSFIAIGRQILQPYTEGVSAFVESLDCEGGLEKTKLRAKSPDEYIRNMLAIGVLSHIHRDAFLKASHRILVLPDCLKNYGEEACCKADLGNATACTMCNSNCLVFEVMDRYDDARTTIVLEPDDMDAYFRDARAKYESVGIVGVACALTMLSGFHYTLKYKMPTQGVFLNYAGCSHHWANPGINTNFSYKRMAWVLGMPDAGEPDVRRRQGATYNLEGNGLSVTDFYEKLDELSLQFEAELLPQFKQQFPDNDLFDLSFEISKAIVPNLITRDSA